ncbi:MAG: hypothetical protein M3O15_13695, partial [Acidobacteriota bacterium]|nr:hypothetical protein [Acidobacteriota bacterium]
SGMRAVAVARGDRPGELAAIKGLSARLPGDQELLERRAELEAEVGDPSAGLKIVQDLAERHPRDPALAEKLATAKFRWRVGLLPRDVQDAAGKPELTKADFAVLLYWLVPAVHYGRPGAGRIATDILEQPHREEIVRVVNLGLMDVDSTLHRFSPGSSLRRGPALRAMVRLLTGFGDKLACVRGGGGATGVCDIATECTLIADAESCQPAATLSGADALELIRHGLELLGGE